LRYRCVRQGSFRENQRRDSRRCRASQRSLAGVNHRIELCAADHGNDAALLERWLANKRPEIVASWIGRPDSSLLVAVDGDGILAVGAVTNAGEITLNYVTPQAQFRGISRALLKALEARALERGNAQCRLHSTETAHRLYLSNGYVDSGAPARKFGMNSAYPMSKRIAPG